MPPHGKRQKSEASHHPFPHIPDPIRLVFSLSIVICQYGACKSAMLLQLLC